MKNKKSILCIFLASLSMSLLLSCIHSENSLTTKMEDHEIVIADSSFGTFPVIEDNFNGDGAVVFRYDSERYKVRVENEILTVNGNCYLVPNKKDSIRIEGDLVKINGMTVRPKNNYYHN